MSEVSRGLEEAVQIIIDNTPADEAAQTRRQKRNIDLAFMDIMKLIAPRVRYFTRQYGLTAHADDAEQCCAIAVHRAIQAYDPEKATFTTFVNWQIKGELQSLRFRLMAEQRPTAKKVNARLVSLHTPMGEEDSEAATLETQIPDEASLDRTEAGASDRLADHVRDVALDKYTAHLRQLHLDTMRRRERNRRKARGEALEPNEIVARLDNPFHGMSADEISAFHREIDVHRDIVERRIFEGDALNDVCENTGESKDRVRRIVRDAVAFLEAEASSDGFRNWVPPKKPARRALPKGSTGSLLPNPDAPHLAYAEVTIPSETDDVADAGHGSGTPPLPSQTGVRIVRG
ncbi:hypothetical protein B5C34_08855 [Pacificimonas flava]|uniref:Uncharacterized protein n=2 Tax=Pacificimonas TaxID=1960290 RepID=A0A219B5K5_9SPHN|nr:MULTISPECIES: sigma factor [Pacificimonas]MBZ6379225.1 sigma-70 family RNA polymerase sigma factor [Pacificimonas aurantium]OWV33561.1 hypothetical protein B5C34_08855 [Pacificimonas flava]